MEWILIGILLLILFFVYMSIKGNRENEERLHQFEEAMKSHKFNVSKHISFKDLRFGQKLYVDVLVDAESERICIRKTVSYLLDLYRVKGQKDKIKYDKLIFLERSDILECIVLDDKDVVDKADISKSIADSIALASTKSNNLITQLEVRVVTGKGADEYISIEVIFEKMRRVSPEYRNAYRFVEELELELSSFIGN